MMFSDFFEDEQELFEDFCIDQMDTFILFDFPITLTFRQDIRLIDKQLHPVINFINLN